VTDAALTPDSSSETRAVVGQDGIPRSDC
jgi:hypothetical protein